MVGPVCIQHPDLRHGRISLLLLPEITLDMQKIPESHGKVQRKVTLLQYRLRFPAKTLQHFHVFRLLIYRRQCIRLLHTGLPRVHRINAVIFNLLKLLIGKAAADHIGHRRPDHRLLILFQKLHALQCGIRPLVELPRQVFHAEYPRPFGNFRLFLIVHIHRRFRKDAFLRRQIYIIAQILHIIADQNPHGLHGIDLQITFDLLHQLICRRRERRFLFHIKSFHVSHL